MEIDTGGNKHCFACGCDNQNGLKLYFTHKKTINKVIANPIIDAKYDGWKDAAHGGIIATLLDEAMVYAALAESNYLVATAKMDVRFKKPVPTGKKLTLEGEVLKVNKRLIQAVSRIIYEGDILAKCMGSLAVVAYVDNVYDENNYLAIRKEKEGAS